MTVITNYGTLKTAIAAKLRRNDRTADIPGYVQRAEAHFNRELRHTENLYKLAAQTFQAEFTNIPPDLRELQGIELDWNGTKMWVEPDTNVSAVNRRGTIGTSGKVSVSIVNKQFRFSPPLTGTATGDIYYYRGTMQDLAGGADGDDNWIILRHPDVYFYRTLMEAGLDMNDDDLVQRAGAPFMAAWQSLLRHSSRSRFGSQLRVRKG